MLFLLGAVACGSSTEPGEEAAPPGDKTSAKDGSVAEAKDASKAPAGASMNLERLIVAISPMGWDTNFTYRTSTTGLLDKRPVQEMLIGVNRVTGAYEPQLAEKWEVAPNGKDWTFTLRQGIQWHGAAENPEGWGEFSARDVRHTTYMHTGPKSVASNGGAWRKITGIPTNPRWGQALVAKKIQEAVEIVDDYTVVYHSNTVQPEL